MKVENNLQFSPGWILNRKKNQINKCHPKMLPLRNMLQKKKKKKKTQCDSFKQKV